MADIADEAPPVEIAKDTEQSAPADSEQQSDAPAKSKDVEPAKSDPKPEAKDEAKQNGHTGSRSRHEKAGRKTNYDALPESSDPVEIRKQVEFYFSDANLARDRFLYQQLQGSKNEPVPVATIHSFKRMRRFQPFSAVVAALQESSTLVIEDAESEEPKIKRTQPFAAESSLDQEGLKQQFEDAAVARTVHARGFGYEQPTTQFDIEAFFAPYGTTNQVRLRRHVDGTFKGSVTVEFDTEEAAMEFLKADPPPTFQGTKLELMSQREFQREQAGDARRRRDGRGDEKDWRSRRDEDRKRGFPGRGGRGGRGGRSGYGGRGDRRDDRNRERRDREDEPIKDEKGANEDKADSKPEAQSADPTTESAPPVDKGGAEDDSKKRSREDEDGAADDQQQQQSSKRARSRSAEATDKGEVEVKDAAPE